MALLYRPTAKPAVSRKPQRFTADIHALDYQCRGIAKIDGKLWFVDNALPQESVQCNVIEEKRRYGTAVAQRILRQSPERQTPRCPHYDRCGGCQSQHVPIGMQRHAKQTALFERLQRLQPEPIALMPMLAGDPWGYRRRIRLSLKFNPQTRQTDIGFRQKSSDRIVAVNQCPVVVAPINALLPSLTTMLARWSQPKQLGHAELVAADNGVALLLRHTQNIAEIDRTLLLDFARRENLMLFVQHDSGIEQWHGDTPCYRLSDGTTLQFDIRDFIQVNAPLNRQMVDTALAWLDLRPDDDVLDLFCGMGNFTLPLAKRVKSAVGIEGVFDMVQKAAANARLNGVDNAEFYRADLDKPFIGQPWAKRTFNKILLDPPRSGAGFALNALGQLGAARLVYVSCNPATLVRDAELLRGFGYRIAQTAMIDMFPQTGHLESVTLFTQGVSQGIVSMKSALK